MDRIDIQVQVPTIRYSDLESCSKEENSETIKKRVNKARAIQKERYSGLDVFCNAGLTGALIREFCKVDDEGRKILRSAFDKLKLSARAHDRILKVARTIADLEESPIIQAVHIAEAIQYRSLDRTVLA